jgi:hypothetical protein
MIRCFLIKPAGRARLSLRRYSPVDVPCKGKSYHDAMAPLFEVEETLERREGYDRELFWHKGPRDRDDVPADRQKEWPVKCESCDYVFAEADPWQVFSESLYRREDTAELVSLRSAPAGAMWFLTWMRGFFNPQLGDSPLCVMTPGGEWIIDAQASNCTMPDDHNQQRHHCWIARGTPPNVTVDKSGATCAAGAGSIQAGNYHGFLQNGCLT